MPAASPAQLAPIEARRRHRPSSRADHSAPPALPSSLAEHSASPALPSSLAEHSASPALPSSLAEVRRPRSGRSLEVRERHRAREACGCARWILRNGLPARVPKGEAPHPADAPHLNERAGYARGREWVPGADAGLGAGGARRAREAAAPGTRDRSHKTGSLSTIGCARFEAPHPADAPHLNERRMATHQPATHLNERSRGHADIGSTAEAREENGAPSRIRTYGLLLRRQTLYPLSYGGLGTGKDYQAFQVRLTASTH